MKYHTNIILPDSYGVLLEQGIDVDIRGRPIDGSDNPGAPNSDPEYINTLRNNFPGQLVLYPNCQHSGRITCVGFDGLSERYDNLPIAALSISPQVITLDGDAVVINLNAIPQQLLTRLTKAMRTWDCGNLMIFNLITRVLALVHVSVTTGYGYSSDPAFHFRGPILDAVMELCGDPGNQLVVAGPCIAGLATLSHRCKYEFDEPDAERLQYQHISRLYPSLPIDQMFHHRNDGSGKVDIDFGDLLISTLVHELGQPSLLIDTSAMLCTMHTPTLYCNRTTRLHQNGDPAWAKANRARYGNLLVAQFTNPSQTP